MHDSDFHLRKFFDMQYSAVRDQMNVSINIINLASVISRN